ncbi:MAG TPA: cobalt ECF transporter T component CbiQ [Candidatus Wunengus sp. YC60]|uniref:cobalt ECF transporter T component CbiQ n=1 Tax=Candidatus Wunengus sp. YC60 TaxID=3367697 RepID=UPI00402775DF
MGFFHHTFSDVYARRNNWLTGIDVRVKLVYIVLLLAINLLTKNIFIPLIFLSASFILLLSVKIHFTAILRNMALPLSFAVFILLIRGLHEGEKVWLSVSVIGYKVVLKEEGLWNGLQTCSKVVGGISLVILLSFITTISQLCAGLKWFRVPNTIIDLLALIYRYIFIFLDEVDTMWTAQKTRLGYASWKKTIKSFGILGGMLVIRAFARAEQTYEAMHARGYEGGGILTATLPPWRKKEYTFVIGIVFVLSFLIYTRNVRIW